MKQAYRKAILPALVALGLTALGASPAAAQNGNPHAGHGAGSGAASGKAKTPAKKGTAKKGAMQHASVTINRGYEPSTVTAKVGQPVHLVFVRKEQSGCGDVVQFPSLGIKRTLKPGQKTTVTFIPKKAGTVAFTCGMNMYQGKVVVR